MEFTPRIHFELEGVAIAEDDVGLDLAKINRYLAFANVDGEVKPEFWRSQWEYVSLFNGQSALKEADNLAYVLHHLPKLMMRNGARQVLLKPVAWSGDVGRYVKGSAAIFSTDVRPVHIPNAIQVNISLEDNKGNNLVANTKLGEYLQANLLRTSLPCCLFFLPEEEAFERIALRSEYGLDAELSSPFCLSGGHQGSIALYRTKGKHNQKLGERALVLGADSRVIKKRYEWQKTARIEHRLGATSLRYNPYINVLFVLTNILEAIEYWQRQCALVNWQNKPLPRTINDNKSEIGAINLFMQDNWFVDTLNRQLTSISETCRLSYGQFEGEFRHTLQQCSCLPSYIKHQFLSSYTHQPLLYQ